MRTPADSSIASIVLSTGLLTLTACGGQPEDSIPDRKPTFPVAGKVLVDDRPLVGATVVFHPVAASDGKIVRAYGKTDASGVFQLSTYKAKDGAPAGRYTVSVQQDADDATVLVPKRYGSPSTSGLTVHVQEEMNELTPFRLQR